jgi:hypothetical protein
MPKYVAKQRHTVSVIREAAKVEKGVTVAEKRTVHTFRDCEDGLYRMDSGTDKKLTAACDELVKNIATSVVRDKEPAKKKAKPKKAKKK